MPARQYLYVGPPEIREACRTRSAGTPIHCVDDLATWLASSPTEQAADKSWIATFTISVDEILYVAPRRSEHVACAAGGPVLSAGEITVDAERNVSEISNQSTGFCPEPESWSAVEAVLDRIGLEHPGEFTNRVVFRLCPDCGQRNIVKDAWYFCQVCDAELPQVWNFAPNNDNR